MTINLTDVEVRLARHEDKERVLGFCNPSADYIHLVWDKWLGESQSRLFVAIVDHQPVAIERVVLLSDHEAWWEGLRVNSAYRGRGLVKYLDAKIEQYLLELKVEISRCCTSSKNKIMHHILTKQGAIKVGSYSPYKAEPIELPLTELEPLDCKDFESIWTLENRPNLYISRGAKWQELTPKELKSRLEQGLVWGIKQNNRLISLAIESFLEGSKTTHWIGYLEGTSSNLPILLQQLRSLAHHQSYSGIGGIFLNRDEILKALEKAGYQKNGSEEYWVYQWTNF